MVVLLGPGGACVWLVQDVKDHDEFQDERLRYGCPGLAWRGRPPLTLTCGPCGADSYDLHSEADVYTHALSQLEIVITGRWTSSLLPWVSPIETCRVWGQ